jgi:gluconate 2-dehydrogenase gamma chain
MNNRSRRSFLIGSTSGLSAIWLASNLSGILDAQVHAQRATLHPVPLVFLTREQAADVDAMASQIIPTDNTPGAHEAGCVYFIDRALTTFLRDSQPIYTQGLKDLQAKTKELFPSASRFSTLTSAQQIQLLTAIENTNFFTTVRTQTIIGMFAGPAHGGNYSKAGWELIGFEDTLNFKPPFGYYDAISKPGE